MKKNVLSVCTMFLSLLLIFSCNKKSDNLDVDGTRNTSHDVSLTSTTNVTPLIGFGIEIEKGVREWSPDGSTSACIGSKKVCKFKITFELPIPLSAVASSDGGIFYDNGVWFLAFPESVLSNPIEESMFENGKWQLTGDVVISSDTAGNNSYTVVAGEYTYSVSGGVVYVKL